MGIKRGDRVRHRPTGRLGRVEAIGGSLASMASWPYGGDGWITAPVADFEAASASAEPQPAQPRAA
jgi:hypothetical protein